MALTGTEADILNSVLRLRKATKDQIRREVGFSLDYIGFLCQYLVRKGYLIKTLGSYSLAKEGTKILPQEEPKIDKKLLKEITDEVAKEISGELKKEIKSIKILPKEIKELEAIKIKTDFEFPVEDESLGLETNIDRIGAKLEKEKSDIESKVELLKEIKKKRH